MRINRFIASATGISRRAADKLIQGNKVFINDLPAQLSDHATLNDRVFLDKQQIFLPIEHTTILLNKPIGYVCSRDGQGSKTVYDLLPAEFALLRSVGRLDKDSSGLLVLTDDGQLAHELTHPKFVKAKIYEITLNVSLKEADRLHLLKGVKLADGMSKLGLRPMDRSDRKWQVTLHEGRNRQIRRTFSALNYTVRILHRIQFGSYNLDVLQSGQYQKIS
jgi:23S rRNA pseudouridine2605 synthase